MDTSKVLGFIPYIAPQKAVRYYRALILTLSLLSSVLISVSLSRDDAHHHYLTPSSKDFTAILTTRSVTSNISKNEPEFWHEHSLVLDLLNVTSSSQVSDASHLASTQANEHKNEREQKKTTPIQKPEIIQASKEETIFKSVEESLNVTHLSVLDTNRTVADAAPNIPENKNHIQGKGTNATREVSDAVTLQKKAKVKPIRVFKSVLEPRNQTDNIGTTKKSKHPLPDDARIEKATKPHEKPKKVTKAAKKEKENQRAKQAKIVPFKLDKSSKKKVAPVIQEGKSLTNSTKVRASNGKLKKPDKGKTSARNSKNPVSDQKSKNTLARVFRTVYRLFLPPQMYSWTKQISRPLDPRPHGKSKTKFDNSLKQMAFGTYKTNSTSRMDKKRRLEYLADTESDIDGYLRNITEKCSGPIDDNVAFSDRCWGNLMDLCNRPRCTTQYDSRVECGTSKKRSAAQVIEEWQDPNATNIVIIGAGPVGMQLANVLLGVNRPMRFLIFESRVIEKGKKKLYSRDWSFETQTSLFRRGDKRIMNFFKTITGYYDVESHGGYGMDWKDLMLPIFMYETLLLLSTRSRGVRFLYGNYRDYSSLLADVPNLVIFDSTGHRLNGAADRSHKPDKIGYWKPPADPGFPVNEERLAILDRFNSSLRVALKKTKSGETLFYPVDYKNRPHTSNTLKMDDYRLGTENKCGFYKKRWALRDDGGAIGHTKICEGLCGSDSPDQNCVNWCDLVQASGSENLYRPGMIEGMTKHHPGFALDGAYLMLTPEQFDTMAMLLNGKINVPISQLPFGEIANHVIFKKHRIGEAMEIFACGDTAILGLFSTKPYAYADPLVSPKSVPSIPPLATLLRVGDSLFNGDSFIANGLSRHFRLINKFAKELDLLVPNATATS